MQQGQLQLDADWNEQVDIQTHLRNAQSVDVIDFESGVPSAETVSGKLNRDGFKISVTLDRIDLAFVPNHIYVNGILYGLESGALLTAEAATDVIDVKTLTLNERSLTIAKLGPNVIANLRFKPGSATTEKLADGAVTADKLANNAVTRAKLANGAIEVRALSQQLSNPFHPLSLNRHLVL